jgi:hypothetical protein
MSNFTITNLKKHLNSMTKEELIVEIADLVKKHPNVKEYYTAKLDPNYEEVVFEKYKKIITNEFLPDRGFGKMRYSVVNKAIRDFSKISNNEVLISKLILYYAEIGVEFTNTFGDIDIKFYNEIAKAYEKASDYIVKHDLQEMFIEEAYSIMESTGHIGWGFSNVMDEIFYNYFDTDTDTDDDEEEN